MFVNLNSEIASGEAILGVPVRIWVAATTPFWRTSGGRDLCFRWSIELGADSGGPVVNKVLSGHV